VAPQCAPRPPAGAALDPEVEAFIGAAIAAVEAAPRDGSRWGRLGRVYESAEYYTLARTCYQAARSLDAASAEWPYHLGRFAADRGELEAAAAYFSETSRLDPASAAARLRLGDAQLRRGDVIAAEDAYARLVADHPRASWGYVGLARVRLRQEKTAAARELLERALALEARDREASYLLALVDAQQGRGVTAAALIESFTTKTSTQSPPDPWLDRVRDEAVGTQAVLRRANGLLAAGDLDAAQPLYEQVLASNPDDVAALVNLGNVHLRRRDGQRALPLFERAVVLAPGDPHPRLGFAMALIAAGQRERGVAEVDEVLRLDPDNAQARAMKEASRQR
jgi:tetratricopeptide (TPR) repeat protein